MSSITRVFSPADQEKFAGWSGDRNPLHVDRVWAATVYPGKIVVHGMHIVLWLLNEISLERSIHKLAVTFIRPILLGDIVEADLTHTPAGLVAVAKVRGKIMMRMSLAYGPQVQPAVQKIAESTAGLPEIPRPLLLQEIQGRKGIIGLPPLTPLQGAFPRLYAMIGGTALCGLAVLSTLVGMECPGLHAVFSEFSLTMEAKDCHDLNYHVEKIDLRFSRANITVDCGAFAGVVIASVSAPALGDDLENSNKLVDKNEFFGQRPLIIGGGSGLGAVTAKLLAVGGAIPIITYNQAIENGRRIQREICSLGGRCELVRLDVTDPGKGLQEISDHGWAVGHIYYFASPRIFRRRLEAYQDNDLKDFMRIYVSSFYELIHAVQSIFPANALRIFYPSSVAAESFPPDMLEYAIAKFAGERVCAALEREFTSLQVLVERLPRVDSRQTRSFLKVSAVSPASIMLPIIRKMGH